MLDAINEIAEEAQAAGAHVDADMLQNVAEKEAEELEIARSFGMRRPPKVRAGFTTNKGKGTPKARRKMAKQSRRANRK